MTYGIIAAKGVETEAIEAAMTETKKETVGTIDFVLGRIGESRVVLATCGVGKVFAAMCAQTMILTYKPDVVVNTGVGGTLTAELGIGDVAVSTGVVQHDMDTSAVGDPVGMISGINQILLPASEELTERMCEAAQATGLHYVRGVIASGDRFVNDAATKERITALFGAIACEMEGAAIGHVCYVNGVPFTVVRSISDSADGHACEDYPAFLLRAAHQSAALVVRLCGNGEI